MLSLNLFCLLYFLVLNLPERGAQVPFSQDLLKLVGRPNERQKPVAQLPELFELEVLLARLQVDLHLPPEVAEESSLAGERVNILEGSANIFLLDNPIPVLVQPVEYKVEDAFAVHEAEGRDSRDVLFKEEFAWSVAGYDFEQSL